MHPLDMYDVSDKCVAIWFICVWLDFRSSLRMLADEAAQNFGTIAITSATSCIASSIVSAGIGHMTGQTLHISNQAMVTTVSLGRPMTLPDIHQDLLSSLPSDCTLLELRAVLLLKGWQAGSPANVRERTFAKDQCKSYFRLLLAHPADALLDVSHAQSHSYYDTIAAALCAGKQPSDVPLQQTVRFYSDLTAHFAGHPTCQSV